MNLDFYRVRISKYSDSIFRKFHDGENVYKCIRPHFWEKEEVTTVCTVYLGKSGQ